MEDGAEHPFLVCVPDMEIFTEGDSFADAIEMARDAIGLAGISMEDHEEKLPIPSEQETAWMVAVTAAEGNECSLSVAFFHPPVL